MRMNISALEARGGLVRVAVALKPLPDLPGFEAVGELGVVAVEREAQPVFDVAAASPDLGPSLRRTLFTPILC
ncbi:hypothetical protein [Planotetraspora phitsanulokensis]|nr:hypothetical protein [Planotetraspora phitsanulokensis]